MKGLGAKSVISVSLLLWLQVISPVYSQSPYSSQQSNCQTPRGVPGNCVELKDCTELVQLLQARRPNAHQYLQQSHCGFSGSDPMVCCAISGQTTAPPTTSPRGTWDVSTNPLLPRECGEDLSQKIVGGTRADIHEFPWMALIEYQKPSGKSTICGGALISKRYVITAAHCINGASIQSSWRLTGVRLGEYDTSTETDCIPEGNGEQFCADPTVTVGVEEAISHEGYVPSSRDQQNDIALIRLSRNVPFTNFIRPLCLPPSSSSTDRFVHVAGWGRTEDRSESSVKLKLRIPLVDNAQCQNTYRGVSINLIDSQICAGGQRGRDSCNGDSGGPLMSVKTNDQGRLQWTAVGVVSFGPSPCGRENWPGVYTKVTDFMPWILSKMRA